MDKTNQERAKEADATEARKLNMEEKRKLEKLLIAETILGAASIAALVARLSVCLGRASQPQRCASNTDWLRDRALSIKRSADLYNHSPLRSEDLGHGLFRLLLHGPVTGILDHCGAHIRGGETDLGHKMCAVRMIAADRTLAAIRLDPFLPFLVVIQT